MRYVDEVETGETATRKLVAGLAVKHRKLTFCYEAAPTGYGLHRLIESLEHDRIFIAPPLIPKKVGNWVETNRRDAEVMASSLRTDARCFRALAVSDAIVIAPREWSRMAGDLGP